MRSMVLSKVPSGEIGKGLAYKREKPISEILQYPIQFCCGRLKPSL